MGGPGLLLNCFLLRRRESRVFSYYYQSDVLALLLWHSRSHVFRFYLQDYLFGKRLFDSITNHELPECFRFVLGASDLFLETRLIIFLAV